MVGSVPGVDVWESTAVIRGELPSLPMLPELPARGPGADMVGRTMALLAGVSSEFAVTTTPTGWRLAGHLSSALPGSMRRASAWLGEDLMRREPFMTTAGVTRCNWSDPGLWPLVLTCPTGQTLRGEALRPAGRTSQASVTFLSTRSGAAEREVLPNSTSRWLTVLEGSVKPLWIQCLFTSRETDRYRGAG
jgi:hypothetical protein